MKKSAYEQAQIDAHRVWTHQDLRKTPMKVVILEPTVAGTGFIVPAHTVGTIVGYEVGTDLLGNVTDQVIYLVRIDCEDRDRKLWVLPSQIFKLDGQDKPWEPRRL